MVRTIKIRDVAYVDSANASTVRYFIERFVVTRVEDFPIIRVNQLYGVDPATLLPEHVDLLKGGTEYIIVDGRHRMLALKALMYEEVVVHVLNPRW